MADILFIKTSSLGDVIHHMPALTDARKARPDARFTWLVEEAFAPLVALHPAVGAVIPVAWRRWRKSLYAPGTLAEIAASLRAIRAQRFDEIVDSQGLLRSGVIARLAHGRRHGYDANSIREPLASLFYDRRYAVEPRIACGRAQPHAQRLGARLHAAGRARFRPRPRALCRVGRTLRRAAAFNRRAAQALAGKKLDRARQKARPDLGDLTLVLPWGTAGERARSERIAAALPRARVPAWAPLDAVARLHAGAQFVVGVDTGLTHLAAALGVPLVAIFSGSEPGLTGPVGAGPIKVLGAQGEVPSVHEVVAAVQAFAR